jgi:enamine deaminase RidA (YjgF/YER057c/UK114 family)
MSRQEHHTANHFEAEYGFSQAVRIGQTVWVAGITATSPNGILHKGSMYNQALEIFRQSPPSPKPRVGNIANGQED